jgi:RNA polymerase sigma factor (sigma-70 family)
MPMHALSYADQMCLLDELVDALSDTESSDAELIADALAWSKRVDPRLSWAGSFQRQVEELADTLTTAKKKEIRRLTRAGLSYLFQSGGPEPESLSQLALQAHAFVIGLLVHRVRRAMGRATQYVPPTLSSDDRSRAEEIFTTMLEKPLASDASLVKRTREFCAEPPIPTGSLFVRRLLRNAEFLASILERGRTADERSYARAALGYLILEEDSIDDRLGLIGFIDDAYILNMAVALIEPAREPWVRLLEATATSWPLLAKALIQHEGEAPVEISRHILTDAALLSEPLATSQGALDAALFVPTAGSTPMLLAVAAAIDMLREVAVGPGQLRADEDDPIPSIEELVAAAAERPPGQYILLAAPTRRAKQLAAAIRIGKHRLSEVLPMGHVDDDGTEHVWSKVPSLPRPLILVTNTLESATKLAESRPGEVRFVLVDLEAASGADTEPQVSADDDEAALAAVEEQEEADNAEDEDLLAIRRRKPKVRKTTTSRSAAFDVLNAYMGEASAISRLSLDDEATFSKQMHAARDIIGNALHGFGSRLVDSADVPARESDALIAQYVELATKRYGTEGAVFDRLTNELTQIVFAFAMFDEHVADLLRARLADVKLARRAKKSAKEVARLEAEWHTDLDGFVETYKLVATAAQRIDEAVVALTRGNLRLVLWMAKKYRNRAFYLDMVQEGNVGLMRAARKFDHRKGARFGSYAGWWIRQAIEGYLSRHSRTIRIPVNTLSSVRRVSRAETELHDRLQRAPTEAELAKHIGIDAREVRRSRRIGHDLERGCVALDGPIDNESGTTLNEMIPDTESPLPLDEVSSRQLQHEARKLLETLDPVEAKVLHLRFGIGPHERHTLAAIGEMIGLTKERIRQIELKALGKLRFRAKRAGVRP